MTIHKKLAAIQADLKAPKGQFNKFGNYNYRSCEDILEAVKPLAASNGCAVIVSDLIEVAGERVYVKATVSLIDCDDQTEVSATAYAREAATKKGMDDAQVTGAASSYARKYALNGLFAIDDTKDADSHDSSEQKEPTITDKQVAEIDALIDDVGADKTAFLGWLKVDSLSQITQKFYPNAVNALEKKRA